MAPMALPAADLAAPLGAPWRRLVARLVDAFTVFFLTFAIVIVFLVSFMDRLSDAVDPEPWGRALMATLLYIAVTFVYEVVFISQRGQTPGKDLLDLKVVSVRTGRHPTLPVAALRALPVAVLRLVPGAAVGTAATLAVGVSVPFDRRRRALHDLLAGTVVVSYDADAHEENDSGDDIEDGEPPALDRDALDRTYRTGSWLRSRTTVARPQAE